MKKRYRIFALILGIGATAFSACDDLMDTHKEFIRDGEIIYAPKPDTVFFVAGKNRIEMNYAVSRSPNVREILVSWNSGRDSLLAPVELPDGTGEGKIRLEGLEEKSYTFSVQLLDAFGHRSLKVNGFGTAYGDNYQASLAQRRIETMTMADGNGIIGWSAAPEGLIRNEVKYTDATGREIVLPAAPDANSLVCPGASTGSVVTYRSAYIPETACIDTFYTEWVNSADLNLRFPHAYTFGDVDRSEWEILFCDNTDTEEGKPEYMFDSDEGSYWHSNYHEPADYPYTFVIDMKRETWIGRLGAMSRQNFYYSRSMSFYVTSDAGYAGNPDGNDWTWVGDLELNQENGMQWTGVSNTVLEKEVSGRYLKVVFTGGYNGNLGAVAELSVQRVAAVDGTPR